MYYSVRVVVNLCSRPDCGGEGYVHAPTAAGVALGVTAQVEFESNS
jgi:hypothetical protein